MTDENGNLSVAMTTLEMAVAPITGGNTSTSSSIRKFYFRLVVLLLGVLGTAANALILYALVASKQHKKHVLIFNQNTLDLFSSIALIVTYAVKICNLRLTGAVGYWVCTIILSEKLVWLGVIGSVINLAIITVERYARVVHPIWSKKNVGNWVLFSAIAFTWIASLVYNAAVVFPTSSVTDGACHTYVVWKNDASKLILFIWKFLSFYVLMLLLFIFCYWRILVVIRRQAQVMAGHNPGGPGAGQSQTSQMQTNVIKTMIIVSAFYAVSWLPTYIYMLLLKLIPNFKVLEIGYYTAEFISWMYICTNPFIYAVKFIPVRNALLRLVPCVKISTIPDASVSTSTTRHKSSRSIQPVN